MAASLILRLLRRLLVFVRWSNLTSLRAVELELDERTMKRLDEIFPGPGGDAPRAYAW